MKSGTTVRPASPLGEFDLSVDGWRTTGCVLCAQNCGLEALVEGGRMVRVRPDRSNPRSQGYVCSKGLAVPHFAHHDDRLTHPLKRVDGRFERVSWDQALDEIAARLRTIVETHGPRSLAFVGGGGQGCHLSAGFGVRLLRGLGSRYHYNSLAQELTGLHWVMGRCLGRQYLHTIPDLERTELLLAIGWNPWLSHQVPQARRHLAAIAKDPERMLVVIDPRRSETARRADRHLAIRPGTDALLLKAMLAIVLDEGWCDAEFVARHTNGLDTVAGWVNGFDAAAAVAVCGLELDDVHELCRLFTRRRSSLHSDLGLLMNRHSTVASYLELVLLAVCGRLGAPGGNLVPGHLMPLGSHSDEREPDAWRTVTTGFPPIMGVYPPNVLPEEILSDHPERVRAVIVSDSNPLRSYADTSAYERAFAGLDLLVTVEVAMSETAALSHYVLPARSAYESWDGTFFALTHPEIYFQLRRPVVEAVGEPLETGDVFVRLADRLGLIPYVPYRLVEAAQGDRMGYAAALSEYVEGHPEAWPVLPFMLARTLGEALGSAHLATLWGLLMSAPKSFRENAARAGFEPGPTVGDRIFQALLDHPEGVWIGRSDDAGDLADVRTEDGRVQLVIEELAEAVRAITPRSETAALAPDPRYPMVLMAGRHMESNANTLMRDPQWIGDRRGCTAQIHPTDAEALGLSDGDRVRVITRAGEVEVEAEVTGDARPGHVTLPHGFGLRYRGEEWGVNVNRLTPADRRDPVAGTPLHRYVPCRLEPAVETAD